MALMLVTQPWQLPPIFIHRAPMHLTGIPDERVRRVRLPESGGDSRCTRFDVEQDIGGPDTGSVLWSGSLVLSAALRAHAASLGLAGASVIELGTGLGLVASVARCLGASTVLATDGDASILPFCERNLARNQGDADGAAAVARLWWGDAPSARRLGQFDLIVGADVVYASDSVLGHGARELSFAGLLCTYWLLAHENTTVVMTYKNRNPLEARFFELSRLHFEVGRLPQIAIPGVPESREVELHWLRRRPRSADEPAPYCV